MLKPPYRRYSLLHIYNVDSSEIEIEDEDLIGIWKDENSALIFFHKNKNELFERLKQKGINVLFYNTIPYEQWESGKYIKPFKIGEFLIKPEWEKSSEDDQLKTIYIDPSVAFGSGFHPTTKMILECFYNIAKIENFEIGADYGCGTGILSLFAAKLGVKKIFAIDNNNLAFEVSLKNVKLNNLEKKITVINDNVFNHLNLSVDFIFANLYYHLLEDLFKIKEFWSARYYFISGFIKDMENRILKALPDFTEVVVKKENENWLMFLVKNSNKEVL